ncbi:MAG TPA: MoxR family ATPase [Fimbriimonadaceae bacterium]|nr:MoxR family ATPase [Fimbriimonadaceae bacterium]
MKPTVIATRSQEIVEEIERVIVGKTETVRRAVLTLLCNGHLLIEDIPGVGKTTLAKALARTIGGDFRRIQFTPDLLPGDITGTSVFNQGSAEFEFRPGPIFGNVVLVDEINRATPKTQSALLEAMEERQVSSDGVSRTLPRPFFVIATQNNIEMTGTYPLPEAQLDRFFARISLGYPEREAEAEILKQQQVSMPLDTVRQVCDTEQLTELQSVVRDVFVHDSIRHYIVDVVRGTREHGLLTMGASPRGSLFLLHAAQAEAAMNGHEFVRPDDVKAVAPMILGHRVIPRGEVRARGTSPEQIIEQVLAQVPAPVPVG